MTFRYNINITLNFNVISKQCMAIWEASPIEN